ncbi:MAG: Type 1 glutamine amidotransferase-like domain-containing protein [Bacilli bacterium]|nr:Type 1 glutamine amidotransferase-like domain-containing protein [Bacilli bacterium]
MIKILMSDFKHYHKVDGEKVANAIDNINGIVDHIKEYLMDTNVILFIASSPEDKEKISLYSKLLFEALKLSDISFNEYLVLDNSTIDDAEEYINKANMIFLSGGDTFVQNEFFNRINLKEKLLNYKGLIVGQSAGAINMAKDAFNSPEEMEESEPIFFEGLGLTDINVEPHFVLDSSNFDETERYQRNIILNESNNRDIYGQCNGSHILINEEGQTLICGETYLISNNEIVLICNNGEKKLINKNKIL